MTDAAAPDAGRGGPLRTDRELYTLLAAAREAGMAGELDRADRLLEAAIAGAPDRPTPLAMRALILIDRNELGPAAQHAARAREMQPHDPQLANLATSIAIRRGLFADAVSMARESLDAYPANQRARCDLLIAARGAGIAVWDRLLDYERLVRRWPISRMPGADAFDRAIADAVRSALAGGGQHPGTLSGGVRLTDTLAQLPPDIADALERVMRQAAQRYFDECPDHACDSYGIVSWANLLRPGGDFERPHIHEAAQISGVYYPAVADDGQPGEAGALVFGEHHYPDPVPSLGRHVIRPERGTIVVFPSYMPHRTVPFGGAADRISIAFDVMATE